MKGQLQRWSTSLGTSTDDFFPADDGVAATFNPQDDDTTA